MTTASLPIKSSAPGASPMLRGTLFTLALLAATLIAYAPAWNGGPVWDDNAHLTRPDLRPWNGLARIWLFAGATQQFYPVTHTLFWIEHRLWGDATTGYHLVNIALHALSALLLLRILRRLRIPGARLAALLFALHPIEVESVAWISELKNTLSAAFFFGALLAYLGFDDSRSRKTYALALVLFCIGLLAKSAIAPLPAALLALLWWRNGRLSPRRDLLPLLPFLAAGLAAGTLTAWMENRYIIGTAGDGCNLPFAGRCIVAGRAFWFYLGKLFFPLRLNFVYPRWEVNPALWWQYLYPAAALAATGGLWALRRRSRAPFSALVWYVALLSPALGFFNVYPFRYSFVADHFQYLAGVGTLVFAAAAAANLVRQVRLPRLADQAAACVLLLFLGVLSWRQSGTYRDGDTLYLATIAGNPGCWMACGNLAFSYSEKGELGKAAEYYQKALEANPRCSEALTGLGDLAMKSGRQEEAFTWYGKAIAAAPKNLGAYHNFAVALENAGRGDQAVTLYQTALRIDSTSADQHYSLGGLYMRLGRNEAAAAEFTTAIRYSPNSGEALNALGAVRAKAGDLEGAAACFERAIALNGGDELAYCNLGRAMINLGRPDRAVSCYRRAAELDPSDPEAANGIAQAQQMLAR